MSGVGPGLRRTALLLAALASSSAPTDAHAASRPRAGSMAVPASVPRSGFAPIAARVSVPVPGAAVVPVRVPASVPRSGFASIAAGVSTSVRGAAVVPVRVPASVPGTVLVPVRASVAIFAPAMDVSASAPRAVRVPATASMSVAVPVFASESMAASESTTVSGPVAALASTTGPAEPPTGPLVLRRQPQQQARSTRTHLVIISGLGGAPAFADAFHAWGTTLATAAADRYGVAADDIHFLAEDPARDPERIDGRSTKEQIERTLSGVAERAAAQDRVLVVVFGHGSARAGESRVSLPGPDLTAADFARLLEQFPTQTVAFVNTASASGGFIEGLAGPNRVIITATRSGAERNRARFGEFFVGALAGDGADVDKDGRVSLLEAFDYAQREVERFYDADNRLLTEHAVLDDDGDAEPSAEPGSDGTDGALAATFFLSGAPPVAAADAPPELRQLYERRRTLEGRLAELRARKESMETAQYQGELEQLLVELALTDREIQALEGGNG